MSDAPRKALRRWIDARYPGSHCAPIVGDASSRRFFRVTPDDGDPVVVMDYGEPFEHETDDVRLERVFRHAGLPVPAIRHVAPQPGCLALQDLGDRLLSSVVADADGRLRRDARDWLERAVDLAASVARRGTPALAASARAVGPALDAARFRFEMDFFVEHYARGLCGVAAIETATVDELHGLADLAAGVEPAVLCHRDFHSRNLMVTAGGDLSMVDIQDARWGPLGYDLASLIRDAYLGIPDEWIESLTDRYLRDLDGFDGRPARAAFATSLHLVSAQRMIKALGTFGYQVERLGRRRYLESVPRTVERLRRVLPARPETHRLGALLESNGLLR